MEALGKMKSHEPVSLDESSLRFKCPSKEYSEAGFRGLFQILSGKSSWAILFIDGAYWRMLKTRHVCRASYHDSLIQHDL